MAIAKILLATDYSPAAKQLLNCIPEMIGSGLKEVVLVHVIDVRSGGGSVISFTDYNTEKLEGIKAELETYGLKVKVTVSVGFVAQQITEIAEAEKVSLILMGSHGQGFIKSVFLGSTAFDVVRISPVPVLIEKYKNIGSEECAPVCQSKFKRIIVPIDFSECSERAVDFVRELKANIDEVIMVSVVESSKDRSDFEEQKVSIERKLAAISKTLSQEGIRSQVRLRDGAASKSIIAVAEEDNATLIVIPKRGAGMIKELLIGSTAEAVAKQAKIPVLLLPCKK